MAFELWLEWPHKILSPNARVHWAEKAKQAKKARLDAYWSTKEAGRLIVPGDGKILISWEFYPPTARRYDDDNLLAMCKAYRDGIADALGIDDVRFRTTFELMEKCELKGVRVLIG